MKGLFLKKLFWAMDSGLAAFSLRSVSALARSMLAMVYGELCRERSGRLYVWEAVTLRDSCLCRLATHYHLPFVNVIFEGRKA